MQAAGPDGSGGTLGDCAPAGGTAFADAHRLLAAGDAVGALKAGRFWGAGDGRKGGWRGGAGRSAPAPRGRRGPKTTQAMLGGLRAMGAPDAAMRALTT